MKTSPHNPDVPFRSLADQVADAIRGKLLQGTWHDQLPGENRLADEFKVSRPTVRRSLQILTRERVLLPPEVGLGRRVCPDWKEPATRSAIPVGVLTQQPLGMLTPGLQSGLRELRKRLEKRGCEVTFKTSSAWGTRQPAKTLRKLIDHHKMRAWAVIDPTPAMERWLEREQIPCVCIGGSYQHTLPRTGAEGNETIRRAVRELADLGHREIFYLVRDQYGVQMVEPFLDELAKLDPARDCAHYVAPWAGHAVECFAQLERLFAAAPPPTAFVTLGLGNLLPLLTWLGGHGLIVPRDVSIIHILADPLLEQLYPPITHYKGNTSVLTRSGTEMLLKVATTGKPFDCEVMVSMKRIDGRSVGPVPGR